ncbi:MAG: alanine--glyoxylate aminotransferase family protein [Candidatus Omnitrophica bacterium]|nr:alanine--glyoxylate aminotransferase family protein [Candidatus Omnitrophota bacterium]
MLKKNFLLSPGPSKVPESVMLEMAHPIFHHRTPQYQAIFSDVTSALKDIFRTKNDVFVFASSGTGAMETSISSLLSPGDKIITVNGGKFGERFGLIGKAFGIECDVIDVEWGKAVDPKIIEDKLNKDKSIKAVYTTLSETSTGVLNDIKKIAAVVSKTNAVLVTDAISGLGSDKLETDEWGVDVVIAGSQKGLMLPPGLAFLSVSEKAWKLVEQSKIPSFYFNLKKYKKSLDKNDVPWTPAITLVLGLQKVLQMIKAEGMEEVWARHARLAQATREAMKALGLKLLSDFPSNAVTAVRVPDGVDGGKLVKKLRDEMGITLAGGQDSLKGKLFRIAHMGYCNQFDVIQGIAAIEEALAALGYSFEIGAGVKKFQETWIK